MYTYAKVHYSVPHSKSIHLILTILYKCYFPLNMYVLYKHFIKYCGKDPLKKG